MDRIILEYLNDVRVEYSDNYVKNMLIKNFTVFFYFDQNPYFVHDFLFKTYHFHNVTNKILLITATEINWKSKDKNPTLRKHKRIKNESNFLLNIRK